MPAFVIGEKGKLALESRARKDIENYFDKRAPLAGEQTCVDDWIAAYKDAIPRTRSPSAHYNCHGLTFASRRSEIVQSSVVKQIINEDDYEAVSLADVLPGDVVLYVMDNGDIEHSGIVVGLVKLEGSHNTLDTWVVSKWGSAHEACHRSSHCPWHDLRKEYYRVRK